MYTSSALRSSAYLGPLDEHHTLLGAYCCRPKVMTGCWWTFTVRAMRCTASGSIDARLLLHTPYSCMDADANYTCRPIAAPQHDRVVTHRSCPYNATRAGLITVVLDLALRY